MSVSSSVVNSYIFIFSFVVTPLLFSPLCVGLFWGVVLYVFRVESSKLLLVQFMSSFNSFVLSLFYSLDAAYEFAWFCMCVCVCVCFCRCIMFGIIFIVPFEQYKLSNLVLFFTHFKLILNWSGRVHFAGSWFKLFVCCCRAVFLSVCFCVWLSLVCICDVRIFCRLFK